MLQIFDSQYILVTLWGYPLSVLEALAVISSLACIYLAAKEKLINFAFGVVATLLYAIFFYQEHLYSSMVLNGVFFGFNIYGYVQWTQPRKSDCGENSQLNITLCNPRQRLLLSIIIVGACILWTFVAKDLHNLLPSYFDQPTSYPFADSLVMVTSIAAQYLMAKKKLENWMLWVVVNLISVFLYGFSGHMFVTLQYIVLIPIAIKGLYGWYKTYRSYTK